LVYADTTVLTLGGTPSWGNVDTTVVFAWPADAVVPPWLGVSAADSSNAAFAVIVESDTISGVTVAAVGQRFGCALEAVPSANLFYSAGGGASIGALMETRVPEGFPIDSVGCVGLWKTAAETGSMRNAIGFVFPNFTVGSVRRIRSAGVLATGGATANQAFMLGSSLRLRIVGASGDFVKRARVYLRYWADEK
jgi:hypothetical protein